MTRYPRCVLSQELEAKQTLLDQLRALATDDPDFFSDIIEGETNLLELIAALDASIVDDETLVDGTKAALDKLQARKRAAESRIELKRRLLAHTLQQIGLKTLRTPTATLTIAEASLKAIAVAPEDIPARWWKPQPPKLDQDGLTKAIRARDKALKEAEALTDSEERRRARHRTEDGFKLYILCYNETRAKRRARQASLADPKSSAELGGCLSLVILIQTRL